jgi:hypothetical protein
MKHHYPNCDLGDRCNCQEIDDIEQEQITTMNNDTPRTNDIIEQIKGFRTSSAIYSLEQFSRLLERELTTVTEQRDSLHELHNKNAARSKELLELCGTLRKEKDKLLEEREQWRLSSVCRELVEQRDQWKAKYIQQNKDLGCEQMDPDGTIWDYAKKVQSEIITVTEQRDVIEKKLRIELRGHPDSELWGDAGLIAATMRCVDALDEVTEQRDEARRLAERYRNISCDSQEEADETLLPWETTNPNEL